MQLIEEQKISKENIKEAKDIIVEYQTEAEIYWRYGIDINKFPCLP